MFVISKTPKPGSKPIRNTSTTSFLLGFKFGMANVAPVNDNLIKNLAAQQKWLIENAVSE